MKKAKRSVWKTMGVGVGAMVVISMPVAIAVSCGTTSTTNNAKSKGDISGGKNSNTKPIVNKPVALKHVTIEKKKDGTAIRDLGIEGTTFSYKIGLGYQGDIGEKSEYPMVVTYTAKPGYAIDGSNQTEYKINDHWTYAKGFKYDKGFNSEGDFRLNKTLLGGVQYGFDSKGVYSFDLKTKTISTVGEFERDLKLDGSCPKWRMKIVDGIKYVFLSYTVYWFSDADHKYANKLYKQGKDGKFVEIRNDIRDILVVKDGFYLIEAAFGGVSYFKGKLGDVKDFDKNATDYKGGGKDAKYFTYKNKLYYVNNDGNTTWLMLSGPYPTKTKWDLGVNFAIEWGIEDDNLYFTGKIGSVYHYFRVDLDTKQVSEIKNWDSSDDLEQFDGMLYFSHIVDNDFTYYKIDKSGKRIAIENPTIRQIDKKYIDEKGYTVWDGYKL